jgi:hypothetical protein
MGGTEACIAEIRNAYNILIGKPGWNYSRGALRCKGRMILKLVLKK